MADEHRELTEKESAALVRRCFGLQQAVKDAVKEGRAAYWKLAEALYEFHEERGWTVLGGPDARIGEWLADPEIDLTKTSYYRAVQLWRDMIVRKKIKREKVIELEPGKAREIAPAIVRGRVRADVAIADAKTLSYSDVVEKYRPDRVDDHGQASDGSTPLAAEAETKWAPCPMCGTRVPESRLPPTVPALNESPAKEKSPRGEFTEQ